MGPTRTGTHIVATTMVGITRSGMTSKRRRTNSQAVGLQDAQTRVRPSCMCRAQQSWETRTCNTRSNVRAQKVGALQAHYEARSKMKTRSGSPVDVMSTRSGQESIFLLEGGRTRKKSDPTRDWNPAIVMPVCQYNPPQNTPSAADITICARKNVRSLRAQRSACH